MPPHRTGQDHDGLLDRPAITPGMTETESGNTRTCPKCGGTLIATPGTMHFRGRDFAGLVCRPCNALWDNPDDSMLAAARTPLPA